MKGALCKLKLVQGRFSSVDEDDGEEDKKEEKKIQINPLRPLPEDCSSIDTGDVNANSTREGGGPTRPLCDLLSPAGQFAYCGFLTEALKILFCDSARDKNFAEATLERFLMHVTLPPSAIMSVSKEERIQIILLIGNRSQREAAAEFNRLHPDREPITQSCTCSVMKMTLSGEVSPGGWKSYMALLKEEEPLAKNFVLLVQDLVIFAVQGGHMTEGTYSFTWDPNHGSLHNLGAEDGLPSNYYPDPMSLNFADLGNYDARTRVLISHCACLLNVSPDVVEMFEESVLEFLTERQVMLSPEEQEQQDRTLRNSKIKRYAVIGLATIGGGALLGLTGGLAAPLIGAGLGTFIGAGGAAAIASTAGMAVIGSLFGAAGAGLTGYKMKKRVGEVEEFAFEFLTQGSSLHITIAVSGWLTEDQPQAFTKPWKSLFHSREQYCLRYESKYLLELGKAMDLLLQFAFSMAVQESLKYTILAGIISAITWPASLLTLASVIDNPWGVCIRRSAEAGRHLAQVLLQRHHGRRPVTLIGFSLGARVIYYCLQELAQRDGSAGIIQDAIFLGAPVPGYASDWSKFGGIVCGRVINGYCQTDWLLRFLYRTSSASLRIAGLEPVNWKDRRMFNFDLSDIVNGHSDYEQKLDIILRLLGIRTRISSGSSEENLLKKSKSDLPDHFSASWLSLGSGLRRTASDGQLFLTTSTYVHSDEKNIGQSEAASALSLAKKKRRLSCKV